ncbi:transposase [Methyloglobulus sp.]|uniref:transposase n=1 Tax=Methyloglobulus sp. TaxID=2518622 RepID=UPI0039899732
MVALGHAGIGNFKGHLPGTYHGVSGHHVQEYLGEFCYRLNQCFWENQIPNRLMKLCVMHQPGFMQPVGCS